MKQLPDKKTLQELLSMGKDLEDRARKIYQMSEALAQKYEQQPKEKTQSSPKEQLFRKSEETT
ncbi:MAG: hypothetical protein AAF383_04505 [Cyanobacteria bacterium P01_A01_bin.83]